MATRSVPIDVLAYNEWSPLTVPHLLAAYVFPNHPAVAELLSHARAPLEQITHTPRPRRLSVRQHRTGRRHRASGLRVAGGLQHYIQ